MFRQPSLYDNTYAVVVMEKCERDPSLAVAHGCFWRLHPAKAFAWELRLGAEIRADFTIDERDSDACRERFFAEQTKAALDAVEKELTRRNRKRKGATQGEAEGDDDAGAEGDDVAKEAPRALRVAKGRLWALDAKKMFEMELRWRLLLGDAFEIDEEGADGFRAAYAAAHPEATQRATGSDAGQGELGLGVGVKPTKAKRAKKGADGKQGATAVDRRRV